MRKDSTAIGAITLLLTAAVIGGVWYMANRQTAEPPAPDETLWTTLEPGVGDATSMPDVAAATSSTRTHDYIVCELPDGTRGYTNAASCAEADFENRLSIADPLVPVPKRQRYTGEHYQTPAQQAKNARNSAPSPRKPNLRLTGKSPPSGLDASCTFAVGKALELERVLSAVDNPRESIWRENYCHWMQEVRMENCEVPGDLFYYGNLCHSL